MKILSTKQLFKADAETIKVQKIDSVELMERAATQCFNWLHSNLNGAQVPIYIFCGIGNNGGDGLAIGRLLINYGYNVYVFIANFTDHRSKDFLTNYERIKEVATDWPLLMTSEKDFPKIEKDAIIIDAIFGIGLNRAPEGWIKKLIQYINNSEAFVLSIDIPSGLYPDKPIEDSEAVIKASYTLTFQNPKIAFFLPETALFTKSFFVVDIGLDTQFLEKLSPLAKTIGKFEAQTLYRPREKYSHKGDFGHSLLIGGSYGKIGAMVLATKAALKIGAGLVSGYIPKCGYAILQTSVPEAMVITDKDEKYLTTIDVSLLPTAIGVGTGMGINKNTISVFEKLLKKYNNSPMVIDADGLNCLAEKKKLLELVPKNSILTPHPGELKRMLGEWTDDYHKIELIKKFSKTYNVIVVCKGANSLLVNKEDVYINTSGNPGMATAGSGDVLTGIITGLLSQGYSSLNAAIFGVYLHGSAGDIASSYLGEEAVIASDITVNLGNAYQELFREDNKEKSKKEA